MEQSWWIIKKGLFMFKKYFASRRAKRIQKTVIDRILAMFPDEPYCLKGTWSWSGSPVDVVFPELRFKNKKDNKIYQVGIAIHFVKPGLERDSEMLFRNCVEYQIPLLLMNPEENPDSIEIRRRIEKIFQDSFTLYLVD
jgi:hypothetical protein